MKRYKNKSIFYWLLCNLKSPIIVTIVVQGHGSVSGTPLTIFKVFKTNKNYLYSRIYEKEAHAGKFELKAWER